MRLFCFGTLLDPDVRRIVLGRDVPPHALRPAVLPGFRRVRVVDEIYPVAIPDPESRIDGVVIEGLTPVERARIEFFEGFEFALGERPVLDGGEVIAALVCLATERLAVHPEPWDFEEWRREHREGYLRATAAFMEGFARYGGHEEAHALWLRHRDGSGE